MSKKELEKIYHKTIEDVLMVEDFIAKTDKDILIEIYLSCLFYLNDKLEAIELALHNKGEQSWTSH